MDPGLMSKFDEKALERIAKTRQAQLDAWGAQAQMAQQQAAHHAAMMQQMAQAYGRPQNPSKIRLIRKDGFGKIIDAPKPWQDRIILPVFESETHRRLVESTGVEPLTQKQIHFKRTAWDEFTEE